jgi:hypothetical protein
VLGLGGGAGSIGLRDLVGTSEMLATCCVADLPLRVSSDPKMHSKSFGVCPSDENAQQTS